MRLEGTASVVAPDQDVPERTEAIAALREKYAQYRTHDLEGRPLLRIEVERTTAWTAEGGGVRRDAA